MVKRFTMALGAILTGVLALASSAFATTDPTLSDASSQVTGYFQDNIGVVIGAVVAISLVLWLIGMLFKSVGANKKKV